MKMRTVALDHRLQPLSLWQHTKRMSPFAAQARGAKELGRRRIAEAQHQRGLKRDGHSFDQSPSSGLAIGIGDFPLSIPRLHDVGARRSARRSPLQSTPKAN